MELLRITPENIDREHICCAMSDADGGVAAKKAWLRERMNEGLVFLRFDVRGKCFIEYIPAEYAWAPVVAPGYMYINCLWVSGSLKGHGLSTRLLDECISDSRARGMRGLVALTSVKKSGFLSDPKYLAHKGFTECDTAEPYFRLFHLPFDNVGGDAADVSSLPRFAGSVKCAPEDNADGFCVYYTDQCPFTSRYVPILKQLAADRGAPFHVVHLTTREAAQNAPCPYSTFSLYYDGRFITQEIPSEKKLDLMLTERGY